MGRSTIQSADYTPRYLVNDREALGDIIKEDLELVKDLGASIVAMGPGVSVYVGENGQGSTFQLDDACWNWLRPLLEELLELRKA
tara:strand:- start:57252 stop:57506 length:255 start_codon:yes stop_codon:yes gene_type:complete